MVRVDALEYSTVIASLFQAIPEAKMTYYEWDMPGEPLPYIVFSFLEESFLTPLITTGKNFDLRARVLRFIERMAASHDLQVKDLLWVGLFETWDANGILAIASTDLGPRSKALAKAAVREFRKVRPPLG